MIVVDDGSTDYTVARLQARRGRVPLSHFTLTHGGANRARNRGANAASGSLLLFIGDDMQADPGLVSAHLSAHRERPEIHVGVVGHVQWSPSLPRTPFLRYLGEPDCPFQFSFSGFDSENVPEGHLYGSHHSVKRAWFERYRGFDEAFRLPAFDDIELECRYRMDGFQLVYEPEAKLRHFHPYDLESFSQRMRTVGRAAVQLYMKHPATVSLTDMATLLALRCDESALAEKIAVLREEEKRLQSLPPGADGYEQEYGRLRDRWRVALVESASQGVHEAARSAGWENSLTALRRTHVTGETRRRRLLLQWGPRFREQGLQIVVNPDSAFERGGGSGRGPHLRLKPTTLSPFPHLYVRLDADFKHACRSPLSITVEYLDVGNTVWILQYDSGDESVRVVPVLPGAYKTAGQPVVHQGTGLWRTAHFRLEDWLFLGRCNGADFRIEVLEPDQTEPLCLRRIEVCPDGPISPAKVPVRRKAGSRSAPITDAGPAEFGEDSEPEISIVMPVHGMFQYTADCLRCIKETASGKYEIIVVDNGSPDETVRELLQWKGIRVVRLERNEGFAVACNRGAAAARGELLLFLNNDMLPLPGWLSALRTALGREDQIGAVGAKLLFSPSGVIQHAGVGFIGAAPYHLFDSFPPHHAAVSQTRPALAVTGACLLIRRGDYLSVGGFDELYRNGFEDVDLCLKLLMKERYSLYCAESVLYHYTSRTPGRRDHDTENFRRFTSKWAAEMPQLTATFNQFVANRGAWTNQQG